MNGFFLILFIGVWMVALYFGFIHVVGRSLGNQPQINAGQSRQQQSEMSREAQEIREQQRQLMRDREQRLKDLQRR